ncbi:hypothetical protein DY000_02047344 [Brassica cretica]|uniref:Translocon Sec61/SecY plug domain-containing protein n=1 Tax=Brassica cretica TaxID=69181 RepID=A0ABQ7F0Y0_BRACR|nr:hypothetical protein DY000_02047344 [Brassica cretica]
MNTKQKSKAQGSRSSSEKNLGTRFFCFFAALPLKLAERCRVLTGRFHSGRKVIYTVISLFIFLVCSRLPLYGIHATTGADPLYWMRVILASNRGTVMELGITPIVTSGLVMQLLAGSKIIEADNNVREDRALLNGAQKLLGILIAIGEAVAYVLSGMYGPVGQLGVGNSILIILQLFFAATNICESIIWKSFSPTTINTGRGAEFEGAVIALFHMLITKSNKVAALRQAFYRVPCCVAREIKECPWPTGLLPDQVVLHLQHANHSPICSRLKPLLHLSATLREVQWKFLCKPIGAVERIRVQCFAEMAAHPFHGLFYIVFMLTACALFSKTWIEVSGSSARDVAKQLKVLVKPNDAAPKTWKACGSGELLVGKVDGSENFGLFGGKRVEVNIWDLEQCTKIWSAKSPPKDNLGIFTPTWFTCAAFMSNEDHRKFVTGTKSHQVRLYDVSAQRRPVMSFDFHETAITAITEDPDGHTVYVGNASADLAAFDIRTGKLLGSFLGKCSGSIRSVVRHPHHQVIASCGLDRYLRVYDVKTRQLISAVFLKQHLTGLVFDSGFSGEEIAVANTVVEAETEETMEQEGQEEENGDETEEAPVKRKKSEKEKRSREKVSEGEEIDKLRSKKTRDHKKKTKKVKHTEED